MILCYENNLLIHEKFHITTALFQGNAHGLLYLKLLCTNESAESIAPVGFVMVSVLVSHSVSDAPTFADRYKVLSESPVLQVCTKLSVSEFLKASQQAL